MSDTFDDTMILIQGPLLDGHFLPGGYWHSLSDKVEYTTISERMADYHSQFKNVLWSTWNTESSEKINYLIEHNINVLLNTPPTDRGWQNMNMQVISTFMGIKYIKENLPHIKYIYKVRGDFIIDPLEPLIQYCKSQKGLGFALYRTDLHHPSDYCMFGEVDEMFEFWGNVKNFNGKTPEDNLILSYTEHKLGTPTKSLEDCLKIGYFFAKFIIENDIKVNWIKYQQETPFDVIRWAITENLAVSP
jgi:hypothetical protein